MPVLVEYATGASLGCPAEDIARATPGIVLLFASARGPSIRRKSPPRSQRSSRASGRSASPAVRSESRSVRRIGRARTRRGRTHPYRKETRRPDRRHQTSARPGRIGPGRYANGPRDTPRKAAPARCHRRTASDENAPARQTRVRASEGHKDNRDAVHRSRKAQRTRRAARPRATRTGHPRRYEHAASSDANPRIGSIEQEVGHEIAHDERGRRDQHDTQYDGEVARDYGIQKQGAEAGPSHQHFDQQRRAQQRAQRKTEQRDQGVDRRRQDVAEEQSPL